MGDDSLLFLLLLELINPFHQQYRQILAPAEIAIDAPDGWPQLRGTGGWELYFDQKKSIFRWLYPKARFSGEEIRIAR